MKTCQTSFGMSVIRLDKISELAEWFRHTYSFDVNSFMMISSKGSNILLSISLTILLKLLYQRLIDAWNSRNAREMAEQLAKNGELIGFDGSQALDARESYHISNYF